MLEVLSITTKLKKNISRVFVYKLFYKHILSFYTRTQYVQK